MVEPSGGSTSGLAVTSFVISDLLLDVLIFPGERKLLAKMSEGEELSMPRSSLSNPSLFQYQFHVGL
jgi:hypothetical protein